MRFVLALCRPVCCLGGLLLRNASDGVTDLRNRTRDQVMADGRASRIRWTGDASGSLWNPRPFDICPSFAGFPRAREIVSGAWGQYRLLTGALFDLTIYQILLYIPHLSSGRIPILSSKMCDEASGASLWRLHRDSILLHILLSEPSAFLTHADLACNLHTIECRQSLHSQSRVVILFSH